MTGVIREMSIEQYREQLQKAHCLVIGDVMLDEYIFGEIERISPEAPVPVVNIQDRRYTLGGAANVAANIRALGVKTTLIGVIGSDHEASTIKNIICKLGIEFEGVVTSGRVTTTKTRIVVKKHQILRLDKEQTFDILKAEDEVLAKIGRVIEQTNVVIVSDYDKGVCTEKVCNSVIKLARKYSKVIIIDPKKSDWTRYMDASMITPNFNEFKEATGLTLENEPASIASAAKKMMIDFRIGNILVTRSQEGMMLINGFGVFDFQTKARDVFDVSGAGDTAVAVVAAFSAIGFDFDEAVKVSNVAAGIAVSKAGTYVVPFDELSAEFNSTKKKKIVSNAETVAMVKHYKEQGKKVVFTNGCFDILHTGHIALLSHAKQLGDILIVGLNSDASVRRLKGEERPVNNENDRALMLAALEAIDIVVIFEEDTPYNIVKDILPDFMVKGGDYTTETIAGYDVVTKNGGQVIIFPLLEEKSTSNLIQYIKKQP